MGEKKSRRSVDSIFFPLFCLVLNIKETKHKHNGLGRSQSV